MSDVDLWSQLRALLSSPSNQTLMHDCIDLIKTQVNDITTTENSLDRSSEFERDLYTTCKDTPGISQVIHLETILGMLRSATPVLSTTSLVSSWFDLVLQPALREPQLSLSSRDCAKELILLAMTGSSTTDNTNVVSEFIHHIVDTYLDVFELSDNDIMKSTKLDEHTERVSIVWKENLEDILLRFGLLKPGEFLGIMDKVFVCQKRNRLRVLQFMDRFVSRPTISEVAIVVFRGPLFEHILLSLQVDDSLATCAVGLSVVIKLLPFAAIQAYDDLKQVLPRLFSILGRTLCWRLSEDRPSQGIRYRDLLDQADEALVQELEQNELEEDKEGATEHRTPMPHLREGLQWDRLERSDEAIAIVPTRKMYFQILYYLFPVNTVFFLRRTSKYLEDNGLDSPWTVGWEEVLDDLQIRTTSTRYLRTLVMHPSVIWYDAEKELEKPDRWSTYDVPRIVGECTMLDFTNASLASQEPQVDTEAQPFSFGYDDDATLKGFSTRSSAASVSHSVSLPEISVRSHTLRGTKGIGSGHATPVWPSLFNASSPNYSTPVMHTTNLPGYEADEPFDEAERENTPVSVQTSRIIKKLQQDVLLLQTELQTELWLKRENMRHVSRLHQDHVVTRKAELERQQLHNRLRDYRSRVQELKDQLNQATSMTQKRAEWSTQLQSRLTSLREEKKELGKQVTDLQKANQDLTARLKAQGSQLAEAQKEVFDLKTRIKTDESKVQRLRDYEVRIEQLTEMHRMWNKDIELYNEQSRMMNRLSSEHAELKLQIESYEKTITDMEAKALAAERHKQTLEASLESVHRGTSGFPRISEDFHTARTAEKKALTKQIDRLNEENRRLREELEGLNSLAELQHASLHVQPT